MASSSPPPSGLDIRRAGPQDWRTYRDLRLAALLDSPRAFWTTYAQAAGLGEEDWRSRLEWPTWIAYAALAPAGPWSPTPSLSPSPPPSPAGLVALWRPPEEVPDGEPTEDVVLVQMWVASWLRGRGVAEALVQAAVGTARADGWRRVVLEVAEENARAAAFYRRAGFVATGRRAVMPWDPDVVEIEMALELSGP